MHETSLYKLIEILNIWSGTLPLCTIDEKQNTIEQIQEEKKLMTPL